MNAIYAGKVEHHGAIYAGEHASIVEAPPWGEIHAELSAGRRERADVVSVRQTRCWPDFRLARVVSAR